MYAAIRELDERTLLPIKSSENAQKYEENPLDLLDHEKLISDLERKKSLFQGRIFDKNEIIKSVDGVYERLKRGINELSEQNIHRMITELETGGNIRFEEGKPTDKWFTSCDDLIRSRFDSDTMKRKFEIADINILRVTRIHNRFLRNRFEEKVEQLVDLTNTSQKKSIEYLFYGVDPKIPNEVYRAMEEGFRQPIEYYRIGVSQNVALVNSIVAAETPRIYSHINNEDSSLLLRSNSSTTKTSKSNLLKIMESLPCGHLLICKVLHPGSKAITIEQNVDKKTKTWNVHDPGLILPEYLVEFEYDLAISDMAEGVISNQVSNKEVNRMFSATIEAQKLLQNTYLNPLIKDRSKGTSFHIASEDLDRSDMASIKNLLSKFLRSCHIQELIDNNFKFPEEDNTVKTAIEDSLPPEIPNRTKYDEITEDLIQTYARETKFDFIKYLNLFNNNIKQIKNLEKLVNLTTLVLSFNEIKEIEGLESCKNLRHLDLNHNFISKIAGISTLSDLNVLNLANNWISDMTDLA